MIIIDALNIDRFEDLPISEIDSYKSDKELSFIISNGTSINNEKYIEITNSTRPFTIEKASYKNTIHINEKYFIEHTEEVMNYLSLLISNHENEITFSGKEFIDERLINSIKNNQKISHVSFYGTNDEKSVLTEDVYYNLIQNKSIKSIYTDLVSEELKENFDERILHNKTRNLIDFYRYSDLQNLDALVIDSSISEKEIDNFKYIGNKLKRCSINVKDNSTDTFNKLKIIVDKLVDKNIETTLKINNKDNFPLDMFRDVKYINKLNVSYGTENVDISLFIKGEDILNSAVKEIKESNLSPFERYISVYNITKRFKEYKEYPGDSVDEKLQARNVYSTLFNDYMVCAGYAKMLKALCDKIDIPCACVSCVMDISEGYKEEEFGTELGAHQRNIVYLKDEKYNLDGYYFSDACWDNDLEHDKYLHVALTPRELSHISKSPLMMNASDLLDIDSVEELLKKMYILSHGDMSNGDMYFRDFLQFINNLNPEYYKELQEKYDIENYFNNLGDDYSFIIDLYKHIQSKTKNKEIKGEIIKQAVDAVNRRVYIDLEDKKREEDLIEMLNYNDELSQNKKIDIVNDEKEISVGIQDKFKI